MELALPEENGEAPDPDWWAALNLSRFVGEKLQLTLRRPDGGELGPDPQQIVRFRDTLTDADDLYRESLRPQFHFTPRRGWNNDPNGLVYYRPRARQSVGDLGGEYHLFFQHNPFGVKWGNMHWGHAVSTDLVHWTELSEALYPRSLDDMAFSGGGTVDSRNTGNFKTGPEDPIVITFTSTGRGECLAYSNDCGRSFREYDGNPVIEHRGRDPRPLWYEPEKKWIAVVYDETDDKPGYAFYDSKNLKTWTRRSVVPGFYECPDLFQLPLDGDRFRKKWILYGAERREENGETRVSRSSYQIGTFDGTTFHPETPILTGHRGPRFYAAQTFSNVPDGRHILMGWLNGAVYPDMPFSQGMTVPLELSLKTTPDGPRLFFTPVRELETLRVDSETVANADEKAANRMLEAGNAELLDLELALDTPEKGNVKLHVRGVTIIYDAGAGTLTCGETAAPVTPVDGRLDLRLLVDRGVLELYADHGRVAFAAAGHAPNGVDPLRLETPAETNLPNATLHTLRPAWQ